MNFSRPYKSRAYQVAVEVPPLSVGGGGVALFSPPPESPPPLKGVGGIGFFGDSPPPLPEPGPGDPFAV